MSQDHPSALDPAAPPDTLTKRTPAPPTQPPAPKHSGRGWVWLLLLVLLAAGAYYFWSKRTPAPAGGASGAGGAQKKGFGAIPVVTAQARKGSIPVYLLNLGGVLPISTVTIKSRVDGELMEVHYKEGDIVQK